MFHVKHKYYSTHPKGKKQEKECKRNVSRDLSVNGNVLYYQGFTATT